MVARWILLALLPIVAGVALLQTRRLSAIIGMGLFSLVLAAVYLLMHAPDVAITEATIGAALVTAIYVLAIRRTGRLTVVADEAPGLIAREGDRITGLEYEILDGFARRVGLDLSIQFVPLRRVRWLVAHQEADFGAGGMIPCADDDETLASTPAHLETGVFTFPNLNATRAHSAPRELPDYEGYYADLLEHDKDGTIAETAKALDLARVMSLGRVGAALEGLDRLDGAFSYAFLVSKRRTSLQRDFATYLRQLKDSGRLNELVQRHFK